MIRAWFLPPKTKLCCKAMWAILKTDEIYVCSRQDKSYDYKPSHLSLAFCGICNWQLCHSSSQCWCSVKQANLHFLILFQMHLKPKSIVWNLHFKWLNSDPNILGKWLLVIIQISEIYTIVAPERRRPSRAVRLRGIILLKL